MTAKPEHPDSEELLRVESLRDPLPLSLAAISRSIGTVLQNPDKQIVASTVANEVAFGLENLGIPRPEMRQRVSTLLSTFGLSHLAERDTFELSGGEKQKVVIAGSLAMEPSVLLLDEPLSNLDPLSGAEVLRRLRLLADAGKAILLVEHRIEDALTIRPDRALLLDNGRQQYWGPVDGFLEQADPRWMKLPVGSDDVVRGDHEVSAAPIPRPAPDQPAAPPLLEMRGVSYWYDDPARPAVADIDLTVRRGDVLSLLGANGAGKSTLLKLGIGLIRPREGEVFLYGEPTTRMTPAAIAHTVGYVFQSPGQMFFAETVREELAFGPRNLGYDAARVDRNVQDALSALDLTAFADRSPFSLSFGQQKRVSIAAVLAMESRILLLDEPTAGQDYEHTIGFMNAILALDRFEAVVFITHDIDLAIRYATRATLLKNGAIESHGRPLEVLGDVDTLRDCHLLPTSRLRRALAR
ncbi:MAG: energy-coupling factor ABC transporter ATP-binding protein [Chloroflexi bacterium]|nr:energy-coupling factor ABC transporter ATP-binding protein [Chloroflexota bacterium]